MLLNPVVISVVLLCVLCLLKTNVLLALMISAIVGGTVAGLPLADTMGTLIGGMTGNAETALSYVLLGTLAAAMSYTGVADILAQKIAKTIHGKAIALLFAFAGIACLSQNLIPVHIAFIPILIPPLLGMMNRMKVDRRGAACALAFGLKAPYIAIPAGFGLIFHDIIADNMTNNGMAVATADVWKSTWFLGAGMITGLVVAILVTYRKPREYKILDAEPGSEREEVKIKFEKKHAFTLLACVVTLGVQLWANEADVAGALPLGALCGIAVMFATGSIKWKDMDGLLNSGVKLMGFIAFVMLIAAGFGAVLNSTGAVEELVSGAVTLVGGSKLMAAVVMIILGLFITMGIGTSFGTVPILAVLYVPLCAQLGFSIPATIILIAAAAALGDAGSPASDTTLGPTAGLNADGQHNHIWDTCVPTFLHYNIPLIIFAIIGSQIF